MALARVDDVEAFVPERLEEHLQGLDRSPRHRDVVAHAVDITPFAAEVDLHVLGARRLGAEGLVPQPQTRNAYQTNPKTKPQTSSKV